MILTKITLSLFFLSVSGIEPGSGSIEPLGRSIRNTAEENITVPSSQIAIPSAPNLELALAIMASEEKSAHRAAERIRFLF